MKKLLLIINLFAFCFLKAQTPVIITIAGNGLSGNAGDGGLALDAKFSSPWGVATDANGNLYIADSDYSVIRKVNKSGLITTIAGRDSAGLGDYSGDGGPATTAKLNTPLGVAVDRAGNIYIADRNNNVIRKVDTSGIISTFAGRDSSGVGIAGYSGDGGPAVSAKLNSPFSVAVDGVGNVYISDVNSVVRKVNSSGIISTFAGTGISGYSGDGGAATSAELGGPLDLAADRFGNIYMSDGSNNVIRKINIAGIISTIAGNGTSGFGGDGGLATSAQLWYPVGVAVDTSGNIYINDTQNYTIRKVNSSGIISTFAGVLNSTGYSGDGGAATAALLNNPYGITVDSAGNLYIADTYNHVIREVGTCIPIIPQICMVEVDSLSKNNIIYWDKTNYIADTFYVYRDTANNNYALIGKVPYNSLSMFTDTVRALFAANGDPNASSWRYKISYNDTCGGKSVMSPMSPWHQTLFMINAGGSFIWTQYQIEGQGQPVPGLQSYLFEREDTVGVGTYNTIQTLSASSTLYTDVNYATYQNTANWRVETKWTTVCTPTLRFGNNSTQTAVVKSRSNVRNNRAIGVNQIKNNNGISIYPNPNTGILNIQTAKQIENASIEIYNVLGEKVFSEKIQQQNSTIDISNLNNGIYQICVLSNHAVIYQNKIVKQ